MKFKALIPFAYETKVFDMKSIEPYEEDEKLVTAWADAGYCKIVDSDESDEKAHEEDEKPLEELGYNELKKRAKAAGIPKYNSMKTEDLIKSLRGE
jgi:hypothetical protein